MKKVVFQGILLLAGIALSNCEIEEPILQETKHYSLISPEGIELAPSTAALIASFEEEVRLKHGQDRMVTIQNITYGYEKGEEIALIDFSTQYDEKDNILFY